MEKRVKIEPLTAESFQLFGKMFELPNDPPPKSGPGWDCWNYIAMMDVTVPVGVGLVKTRKREIRVESMERHVSREELLLPLEKEIIQPVAQCRDTHDPEEMPEAETVRCFRIKPGQGVVIARGVWHSPACPVDDDTVYLFAIEKKKDAFGDEIDRPWVPFAKGMTIRAVDE